MNLNKNKSEKINLDQLLGKLKKEDANYGRMSRALQIMYWVLIPIYSFMTVSHYTDSGKINDLIGGLAYVIAFLIFAIVFGKYHKEYKYADYSLPTLRMLEKAVHRYQPFKLETIWAFIAVLFMDAGLCLNTSLGFSILDVQIHFLGAILLAALIGLLIWYFKYKPIRDHALAIIAEIEGV